MTDRRIILLISMITAAVLQASIVRAERPFLFVSRAEPLDQGTARVEGGLVYERFSGAHYLYRIETALFFGVLDNLDFQVSLPYLFITESHRDDGGVGDVSIKTRLRLIKARQANPLTISAQLDVKLPSANRSKGLGTGESDVGLSVLASKRFEPLVVHLNLGYIFVGDPPGINFKNEVTYALGFEIETPFEDLRIYSELGGHTNRDSGAASDPLAVSFGLMLPVGRRTVVDAGLAIGLASASPSYTANTGVTYRF